MGLEESGWGEVGLKESGWLLEGRTSSAAGPIYGSPLLLRGVAPLSALADSCFHLSFVSGYLQLQLWYHAKAGLTPHI